MKRLIAWVIFLCGLFAVVQLVSSCTNPWAVKRTAQARARLADEGPSAAALWIPSCADKVGCK